MNLKKIRQKVLKKDWYLQGGAAKRLYLSYPFYACDKLSIFGKKLPETYDWILIFKKYFTKLCFTKKSFSKIASIYYKNQVKDKNFIDKLRKHWHKKYLKKYLLFNAKFLKKNLTNLPDKILLKEFDLFSQIYLNLWSESVFLDSYDYYGEKILEQEKSKLTNMPNSDEINVLLLPAEISFLQKEELAILKLAEKINKNKKLSKIITNSRSIASVPQKYSWVTKTLTKISHTYYWIANDYASIEYLSLEYFYQKLFELIRNEDELRKKQEMKNELRKLPQKKKNIIKKYRLPNEFVSCVTYLSKLVNFRDERKSYNQMAGNILLKFAKECSRRTDTPLEYIEQLFFWEIKSLFSKNKEKIIKLAKKRSTAPAFYCPIGQGKFYEYISRKVLDFEKELVATANHGFVGKPAYGGVVKGIAKIILTKNDFHKMKKGDIIIAPNTRPEYVPIMRIAGGIVTEEGGITCHAAIVSRELKISCLVGVQAITSALKDGDIIELDANNGIIKKITNQRMS